MPVDGRPFMTLSTPSGATCKCLRPEFKPLAQGVTVEAPGGTVFEERFTHTIPVPLTQPALPADLVEGAMVGVDVERGQPPQFFRVLRGGIDKGPGFWTLYVVADGQQVAPAPTDPQQGAAYDGWRP